MPGNRPPNRVDSCSTRPGIVLRVNQPVCQAILDNSARPALHLAGYESLTFHERDIAPRKRVHRRPTVVPQSLRFPTVATVFPRRLPDQPPLYRIHDINGSAATNRYAHSVYCEFHTPTPFQGTLCIIRRRPGTQNAHASGER